MSVPPSGYGSLYIVYEVLTTYSDLPTSFYEAELDYFGKHMYDEKGDRAPGPTEGMHLNLVFSLNKS